MSFLFSVPELVESASQDLAGIRSSLGEATASAAGSTTSIAAAGADEISAAVAELFGTHGQQFQALSAEAAAFHDKFVGLLGASTAQYAGAEASAQALLAGSAATGSPLDGFQSFLTAVEGPYQTLFQTTGLNVQAIQNTFSAHPFPFVTQILNNQVSYLQQAGTGFASFVQNLPTTIANLPTTIQNALNNIANFNPAPYIQGFLNTTVANAQTVVTGLTAAGQDLITGFQEFPGYLNTAWQDALAGNFAGAGNSIAAGIGNIILPGFGEITLDINTTAPVPIPVLGALGDLAPILALPGEAAQGFTNLLPVGSIPAQIAQNVTNTINLVTNTAATLSPQNLALQFGLPLEVVFDTIGAPINAASAFSTSVSTFATALQAGNYPGALVAILDSPAVVANGFLNGQTYISLPPLTTDIYAGDFHLGLITQTATLPVGGLLTPLSAVVLAGGGGAIPGTPIGGLIPGMLNWGQELAAAITPLG